MNPESNRKAHTEYMREWREKRRAEGRCCVCGGIRPGGRRSKAVKARLAKAMRMAQEQEAEPAAKEPAATENEKEKEES